MVVSAQPSPSPYQPGHLHAPAPAHLGADDGSQCSGEAAADSDSQTAMPQIVPLLPGPPRRSNQALRYVLQRNELQARQRFRRARGAVDSRMPQAELLVTVLDQLHGSPVGGAAVSVVELQAFLNGSVANCGSTQRRTSKTDSRGRAKCTILGSYRYVLIAPLINTISVRMSEACPCRHS